MERTDFLLSSLIAWKACSISDSISFRIHLLWSIFLFFLFMSAETNFSLASISSASFIPWPIYNCLLFNTFFKSLNLTSISLNFSLCFCNWPSIQFNLWVAILPFYGIWASFYIKIINRNTCKLYIHIWRYLQIMLILYISYISYYIWLIIIYNLSSQ